MNGVRNSATHHRWAGQTRSDVALISYSSICRVIFSNLAISSTDFPAQQRHNNRLALLDEHAHSPTHGVAFAASHATYLFCIADPHLQHPRTASPCNLHSTRSKRQTPDARLQPTRSTTVHARAPHNHLSSVRAAPQDHT